MANELLPFGTGVGANVLAQAAYQALAGRTAGFSAGVAQSAHVNKVLRQAAFAAAMIGDFSAHNSGFDTLDDGDVATFEAHFKAAVQAAAQAVGLRRAVTAGTASAATITLSPAPTSYTGLHFLADITTGLNALATLNVNGLGAKALVREDGTGIGATDAPAGSLHLIGYDGTSLRVLTVYTPLASQAEHNAGALGTKAATPAGTAQSIQSGAWLYGADTGTADALLVALTPTPAAYSTGMVLWVKKNSAANAAPAPTINVNNLGAKTITALDGSALRAGDLPGSSAFPLLYDGTNFRAGPAFSLASQAEHTAGTLTTKGATPGGVAQAVQAGSWVYGVDSGSANALIVTLTPAPMALTAGMELAVKVAADNTGPATINVNGLGLKTVKRYGGAALQGGELIAGGIASLFYDGTNFQIGSPLVPPPGGSTQKAPKLIGFRATGSGQSIPTTTNTQLALTVAQNNLYGTSTFASNALTVGAGEGGVWVLTGFTQVASGSGGLNFISTSVRKNGTQVAIGGENAGSGLTGYSSFCEPIALVPGDVLTWFTFHQAGGTLGTTNHSASAYLVSAT